MVTQIYEESMTALVFYFKISLVALSFAVFCLYPANERKHVVN